MKFAKQQSGWTFWSLLFTLSVVLFIAYVGMQLVPLYAANANVKNAMNMSLEGKNLRRITRTQIIRALQPQLYLDGSHNLLDYKKDLKISRNNQKFLLEISYRREIPLFYDLSLVVDFNNIEERSLLAN